MRRIRDALQKSSPHSLELLKVNDFLDKMSLVTSLQAGNLGKLTAARRTELIKKLLEEEESFQWPPDVQLSLVTFRVKACVAEDRVGELIDVMNPIRTASIKPGDEFDALKPLLCVCVCEMDEVAFGRVFLKLLVAEVLIPLLLHGSAKVPTLKAVVEKLRFEGPAEAGAIIRHAVAEGRSFCEGLSALVSTLPSADMVKELDAIMGSKEGMKLSLRQAVLQSPHFKTLECSLRQTRAAHASLGPVLEKHLSALKNGQIDVMGLTGILADLPAWRSSLRAGATGEIEACIVDTLQLMAKKSDGLDTDEKLAQCNRDRHAAVCGGATGSARRDK